MGWRGKLISADIHDLVLSTLDGMQLARVVDREVNTTRLAAITGSLCALGEPTPRKRKPDGQHQ